MGSHWASTWYHLEDFLLPILVGNIPALLAIGFPLQLVFACQPLLATDYPPLTDVFPPLLVPAFPPLVVILQLLVIAAIPPLLVTRSTCQLQPYHQ